MGQCLCVGNGPGDKEIEMATETKRRANAVMAQRWLDGRLVTSIAGHPDVMFDPAKASATNRARAMNFGWQQRIADAGAVEKADKEGAIRTPIELNQMRYARITALVGHYESGTEDWAMRATGGGVDAGLTIQAIMRWRECTLDEANGLVDALATKREVDRTAALRLFAGTKQVADAIAAIRAERATVDGDDLLSELESE